MGPGPGNPCYTGALPASHSFRHFHRMVSDLKYACHPVCAGQGFGDGDDQIGQLHQFHQDLGHIVDDGNHFPLCQVPHIYLDGTDVDQCHNGTVHNHICHRVHHGTDLPHEGLAMGQCLVVCAKTLFLLCLPVEGPDHPDTCQVLPGNPQNLIQPCLYLLVQGHGPEHDAEDHQRQQGNGHHEDQGALPVNGKGHDHSPEHNDGGAQEQTQHHIHTGLYLVDIAGHTGNHGRCTRLVHVGKVQSQDVVKKRLPKLCGEAHRRFRRKKLCRDRTYQPYHSQPYQAQAHLPDISCQ